MWSRIQTAFQSAQNLVNDLFSTRENINKRFRPDGVQEIQIENILIPQQEISENIFGNLFEHPEDILRDVENLNIDNLNILREYFERVSNDPTRHYLLWFNMSNGLPKGIPINSGTIDSIMSKLGHQVDSEEYDDYKGGSDNINKLDLSEISNLTIKIYKKKNRDGAYFPYYYVKGKLPNLKRYGIYSGPHHRQEHCLVHACKESGQFTKFEITEIRKICLGTYVPISKVSNILKRNVIIHKDKDNNHKGNVLKFMRKEYSDTIELGLINNHYFLFEKVEYIKLNRVKRITTSFKIIKTATFKPIPEGNLYPEYMPKEFQLNPNDCYQTKSITFRDKAKLNSIIIYADIETLTDGPIHVVDSISYITNLSDICIHYVGENCIIKFLNDLTDIQENVIIYFHNLRYDYQCIYKYIKIISSVQIQNTLYSIKALYKGKNIEFRDSYKMISQPLKSFAKTFALKVKKEIFPYDLYSTENCRKQYLPLREINKYLSLEDTNEMIKNLKELNLIKVCSQTNQLVFNHIKYREFYNNQDVIVLKKGMETFAKWVKEGLNLNIYDYLSNASLADNYLIKEGCYEDVNQISGTVREFIQKCCVGGRVTTYNNQKWSTNVKMEDFDAVALYTSSMARIPGFPKGDPKICGCNLTCDYSYMSIKIKKFNKVMFPPTVSFIGDNGNRYWPSLEDQINWEQSLSANGNFKDKLLYVDKITLEDTVKYHGIEYEIIDKICFNNGFNSKINQVISKVFKMRLQKKNEGNPIQEVYKLILNSSYGKTLMKAHNTSYEYPDNLDNYISKNANNIKEIIGSGVVKYQNVLEHYNRAHCGSIVLSMSKRIMNEVTECIEEVGGKIWYNDTDSMHIESEYIDKIAKVFKNKYKKELIGKHMGQFHCDFPNDLHAIESVFISPKVYCDKLSDNTFHVRCKGISSKSLYYEAKQNYGGDLIKMYNSNQKITFDLLCDGQIKFDYVKGGGVRTNKHFKREIAF